MGELEQLKAERAELAAERAELQAMREGRSGVAQPLAAREAASLNIPSPVVQRGKGPAQRPAAPGGRQPPRRPSALGSQPMAPKRQPQATEELSGGDLSGGELGNLSFFRFSDPSHAPAHPTAPAPPSPAGPGRQPSRESAAREFATPKPFAHGLSSARTLRESQSPHVAGGVTHGATALFSRTSPALHQGRRSAGLDGEALTPGKRFGWRRTSYISRADSPLLLG